jgi:DNA polymerase-1
MAMNAPLQGTAADIIKKAMIEVDQVLTKNKLNGDVYLLLQIHDELLFEVRTEKLAQVKALIQPAMENIEGVSIKLAVEEETGQKWGDL